MLLPQFTTGVQGVAERTGRFAARLKELRKAAGLSQPGLAETSGVPVGTIRGFEVGRREPTFGTLLKLAAGLGVSLAAFETLPEGGETTAEEPAPKKRAKKMPRRRKPGGDQQPN